MKRGFTLVEISLVIILIGLVAGGILIANSMASATGTQKLLKEVKQYQAAVAIFKETYGTIPGDLSNPLTPGLQAPFAGRNADGHWAIDGHGWLESMEGFNMWPELTTAGMVDGNYKISAMYTGWAADVLPAATWAGKGIPKLSNGSSLIGTSGNFGPTAVNFTHSTCQSQNFLMMVTNEPYWETHPSAGAIHYLDAGIGPVEAKAIDAKIDDGVAYTGKVLAERGNQGEDVCKLNAHGYGHIEYEDDYILPNETIAPQNGCRLYICVDEF